jgi:hypothetical protein
VEELHSKQFASEGVKAGGNSKAKNQTADTQEGMVQQHCNACKKNGGRRRRCERCAFKKSVSRETKMNRGSRSEPEACCERQQDEVDGEIFQVEAAHSPGVVAGVE